MLIFDLAEMQELQGFVRGILAEEERNPFSLAAFLPSRNIDEIGFQLTKGALRDQNSAVVRAFDSPAPIGERQGIQRLFGELVPISKKIPVTEEQALRLRMMEGGGTARDRQRLIDAIYNDAANLARSVIVRVERMRGEALYSGKIELAENGVRQTIDWARAAGHTVAPGVLWSDTVNAVPITNLMTWNATFAATNGISAAFALISTRIFNYLTLNAQYRSLAAYAGVTPPFLGLAEINQINAQRNLPQLVINDELVRNENGVQVRVIPDDRVVFVPPANESIGIVGWGTTREAIELVDAEQIEADQAPGLTSVVDKTFDPVQTWTKVAGIALPLLPNADLTLTADVA